MNSLTTHLSDVTSLAFIVSVMKATKALLHRWQKIGAKSLETASTGDWH